MAKRKPRQVVVYALFRVVSFFIYLLPLRSGLKLGQCIGKIAFLFLKKQRRIALDNLEFSLSDSRIDKSLIARQVFENLGKNFVEVISLSKFNKANIDAYIKCNGFESIERLLKQGKGGIVLSAHFGNWELMAHYFALKGYKVNVVARRVRNEFFERFLGKVRRQHGVNVLYRDASAKEVFAVLKRNEFIGMMPDQDMTNVSGVFVDFFDRKAYTPNGPAVLNFLTGTPIVPCFMARKGFGHEILVGQPIELQKTGDKQKDILENTQRYTRVIEDHVRKFPSQWVWFHERWKTKENSHR